MIAQEEQQFMEASAPAPVEMAYGFAASDIRRIAAMTHQRKLTDEQVQKVLSDIDSDYDISHFIHLKIEEVTEELGEEVEEEEAEAIEEANS